MRLVGVGYASEGMVKRLEVELKCWRGVLEGLARGW